MFLKLKNLFFSPSKKSYSGYRGGMFVFDKKTTIKKHEEKFSKILIKKESKEKTNLLPTPKPFVHR